MSNNERCTVGVGSRGVEKYGKRGGRKGGLEVFLLSQEKRIKALEICIRYYDIRSERVIQRGHNSDDYESIHTDPY